MSRQHGGIIMGQINKHFNLLDCNAYVFCRFFILTSYLRRNTARLNYEDWQRRYILLNVRNYWNSFFCIFIFSRNLRVLTDFSEGFSRQCHCNASDKNRADSYGQTNRYEVGNRQISQQLCSYTYKIFTEFSKASSGTQNLYNKWAFYDFLKIVWPVLLFIWSCPVAQSSMRIWTHLTCGFTLSYLGH